MRNPYYIYRFSYHIFSGGTILLINHQKNIIQQYPNFLQMLFELLVPGLNLHNNIYYMLHPGLDWKAFFQIIFMVFMVHRNRQKNKFVLNLCVEPICF